MSYKPQFAFHIDPEQCCEACAFGTGVHTCENSERAETPVQRETPKTEASV